MKFVTSFLIPLFFLFSVSARAETYTLWESPFWSVTVVSQDETNQLYCRLTARNAENSYFNVIVEDDGFYRLSLFLKDVVADYDQIDLKLRLTGKDRPTNWTLNDANFINLIDVRNRLSSVSFGLGYDPSPRDFFRDFMSYQTLFVLGERDETLSSFSLVDSKKGLVELDLCRQRIMTLQDGL